MPNMVPAIQKGDGNYHTKEMSIDELEMNFSLTFTCILMALDEGKWKEEVMT